MSIILKQKFINGLKLHNISYDDIINNQWKYCGGDTGSHYNYFNLFFKYSKKPLTKQYSCVCGHSIFDNCYITDGKTILVLGNCCIKKFIPNSSRSCDMCNVSHKNRIVNRCNDCRIGRCDGCGKKCDQKYKKCYKCTFC
jgi:hypothetical protein